MTKIRKIEGDRQAMVRDLTAALGLDKPIIKKHATKTDKRRAKLEAESPSKRIWINPITQHIMLKVSYLEFFMAKY